MRPPGAVIVRQNTQQEPTMKPEYPPECVTATGDEQSPWQNDGTVRHPQQTAPQEPIKHEDPPTHNVTATGHKLAINIPGANSATHTINEVAEKDKRYDLFVASNEDVDIPSTFVPLTTCKCNNSECNNIIIAGNFGDIFKLAN